MDLHLQVLLCRSSLVNSCLESSFPPELSEQRVQSIWLFIPRALVTPIRTDLKIFLVILGTWVQVWIISKCVKFLV